MIHLQLLFIILAFALAWVNKWPVIKFRETGANEEMEDEFHDSNALVKFICAFIPSILLSVYDFATGVLSFFLFILILWLVFDIALNKFTDKATFYVGNTAKLDKLQRKHLGKYAGQIKAAVCLVLIGLLNWLYYSL